MDIFAIFWPPPPHEWTVFIPWSWTKPNIFWPPPPHLVHVVIEWHLIGQNSWKFKFIVLELVVGSGKLRKLKLFSLIVMKCNDPMGTEWMISMYLIGLNYLYYYYGSMYVIVGIQYSFPKDLTRWNVGRWIKCRNNSWIGVLK